MAIDKIPRELLEKFYTEYVETTTALAGADYALALANFRRTRGTIRDMIYDQSR